MIYQIDFCTRIDNEHYTYFILHTERRTLENYCQKQINPVKRWGGGMDRTIRQPKTKYLVYLPSHCHASARECKCCCEAYSMSKRHLSETSG